MNTYFNSSSSQPCPQGTFTDEFLLPRTSPCSESTLAFLIPTGCVVVVRIACAIHYMVWWWNRRQVRIVQEQTHHPHVPGEPPRKRRRWWFLNDNVLPITATAAACSALLETLVLVLAALNVANSSRNNVMSCLLGGIVTCWGLIWVISCQKLIHVGMRVDTQGRELSTIWSVFRVAPFSWLTLALLCVVLIASVSMAFAGLSSMFFVLIGILAILIGGLAIAQLQKLSMAAIKLKKPDQIRNMHINKVLRSIRLQQTIMVILGIILLIVFELFGSGALRLSWKACFALMFCDTITACATAASLPSRSAGKKSASNSGGGGGGGTNKHSRDKKAPSAFRGAAPANGVTTGETSNENEQDVENNNVRPTNKMLRDASKTSLQLNSVVYMEDPRDINRKIKQQRKYGKQKNLKPVEDETSQYNETSRTADEASGVFSPAGRPVSGANDPVVDHDDKAGGGGEGKKKKKKGRIPIAIDETKSMV